MKQIHNYLLALLLLAGQGCAYLGYVKDPFVDIPAFAKVNDNLYRGGVPNASGYTELKARGINTVLDLRDKPKQIKRARNSAAEYGFNYINVPLSIFTWPEEERVLQVLQTFLSPEAQPVYVFCSNGRDRTGAMIAMYRVIVEKDNPKQGYKEALTHGLWPYRGEVVLKKWIHQLKDRKLLYDYAERML